MESMLSEFSNMPGLLSLEEFNELDYGLNIIEPLNGKCDEGARLNKRKHIDVDTVVEEKGNREFDVKSKKKNGKKRKKKKLKKTHNVGAQEAGAVTVSINEDGGDRKSVDEAEFSSWNELRLHPCIMASIYSLGFKEPTPIQRACIPAAAHQGKDVVGAAETGSGKTLAFGLPIMQRLLEEREKAARKLVEIGEEHEHFAPHGFLRALVITPTRELALQVADHLKQVAKVVGVRVVSIIGGMSLEKQERVLKIRPEIIVGTPGRLWELISEGERHLVELQYLSFFVLDEADRMIETGHFSELQSIVDMLPSTGGSEGGLSINQENIVSDVSLQKKKRQTLVFSATIALSPDFRKKLKCSLNKPKRSTSVELNSMETLSQRAGMRDNVAIIDLTNTSILASKIEESFIECSEDDKDAYLYYILCVHGHGRTIVFCTSIAALRHISSLLRVLCIDIQTLHGQMQQHARLKAIDRFRSNENSIVVATDVAARGLDVHGVRTVVHYQLPHSAEVYVHRSGRTARASSDGCIISLVTPSESFKFATLCKSFSKETFRRFPFEEQYMPEMSKRLLLARQICHIVRKDSQDKARKKWFERNAESVELIVDNDDSEEERVKNVRRQKVQHTHLKKLQQELSWLLSHPVHPKSFSRLYFAGAGVSPLVQNQLQELVREKNSSSGPTMAAGCRKQGKFVVIGQDSVEPLQALRNAGAEVCVNNVKDAAARKRKHVEMLKKQRREEKRRLRDERRRQKMKSKS